MNSANQMTAAGVVGAVIIISQKLIQAFAPGSFWTLVQNSTEFWAALQLLMTYIALHLGIFRNGDSK